MLFARILITFFLIKKCIGYSESDEYLTHDEYKQKPRDSTKIESRIMYGNRVRLTLKGNYFEDMYIKCRICKVSILGVESLLSFSAWLFPGYHSIQSHYI